MAKASGTTKSSSWRSKIVKPAEKTVLGKTASEVNGLGTVEYRDDVHEPLAHYWNDLKSEYKGYGDINRDFTYDYVQIAFRNGNGERWDITISQAGDFSEKDIPWITKKGTKKYISPSQLKVKDIIAIRSWIHYPGSGGLYETITPKSYTSDERIHGKHDRKTVIYGKK